MAKENSNTTISGKKATRPVVEKNVDESKFAIHRSNYTLIAIGFGVVVLGFILMAGGGSDDPYGFNPEVFSFRRITLAPIVVLAGFAAIGWAIMRRPVKD
jgi:hypothetical protein